MLIPLGPLDRERMQTQIDGLTASGYTPISLALTTAVGQLPGGDQEQAIVQADNANQLAARLLATQNLAQAQNSLSGSGFGGIELGDKLADIRKVHPDFPDGATSGEVRVVYVDCDYVFVDGVLDSIEPHGGGRTIDGVVPGTALSRVSELYGDPVLTESDGHGGYRLTYRANGAPTPATGWSYRTSPNPVAPCWARSSSGGPVYEDVDAVRGRKRRRLAEAS